MQAEQKNKLVIPGALPEDAAYAEEERPRRKKNTKKKAAAEDEEKKANKSADEDDENAPLNDSNNDIADVDWMYTPKGYAFQALLLLLLVSGDGLKHQYASFAVKDTAVLPQSLAVAGNVVTVLVAVGITVFCHGMKEAVEKCCSLRQIYANSGMALAFSIGQSCHILQLMFISAAMGKIIVQSKLPFLVLGSQWFLGRKQNGKQYLTVVILTAAIVLFIQLKKAPGGAATEADKGEADKLMGGVIISLIGSVAACIGTLLNEKQMKSDFETPFYIQRFHQGVAEFFFNVCLLYLMPSFIGWMMDATDLNMGTDLSKDLDLSTYKLRILTWQDPAAGKGGWDELYGKLEGYKAAEKQSGLAEIQDNLQQWQYAAPGAPEAGAPAGAFAPQISFDLAAGFDDAAGLKLGRKTQEQVQDLLLDAQRPLSLTALQKLLALDAAEVQAVRERAVQAKALRLVVRNGSGAWKGRSFTLTPATPKFDDRLAAGSVQELIKLGQLADQATRKAIKSPFKQKKYLASVAELDDFVAFAGTSPAFHTAGSPLEALNGVFARQRVGGKRAAGGGMRKPKSDDETVLFCRSLFDPESDGGVSKVQAGGFLAKYKQAGANSACFVRTRASAGGFSWSLRVGHLANAAADFQLPAELALTKEQKQLLNEKQRRDNEKAVTDAREEWQTTLVGREEEVTKDFATEVLRSAKPVADGVNPGVFGLGGQRTPMWRLAGSKARGLDVFTVRGKWAPGFRFGKDTYICDPVRCSEAEIAKFEYITTNAPYYSKEDLKSGFHDDYGKGFFAGWDLTVYVTIFFFSWYYTVSAFVVKRLNAVWRHVAGSVTTLILFYTQDLYYMADPEKPKPHLLNVTLAAAVLLGNVFMYLILKQDAKKTTAAPEIELTNVDGDDDDDKCTEISFDGSTRVVSVADAAEIPGGGQWDRMSHRSRGRSGSSFAQHGIIGGGRKASHNFSPLLTASDAERIQNVEGMPLLGVSRAPQQGGNVTYYNPNIPDNVAGKRM